MTEQKEKVYLIPESLLRDVLLYLAHSKSDFSSGETYALRVSLEHLEEKKETTDE